MLNQDMFPVQRTLPHLEEVYERGPTSPYPLFRGAALAVVKNPFAGRYEPVWVNDASRRDPGYVALRDFRSPFGAGRRPSGRRGGGEDGLP